ncbi:hypothetical protein NDU88_000692 [Pleurodeles waltl]|uniref:Carboxylesterase type B domain-containing protein n=2 Tax=Pleurodeles waltl TaxID=8319 RepID=A0AAV7Q6G0_PLEWA|nr:hypothetical protein NDU88_000692 [Pleurodeles waltl]
MPIYPSWTGADHADDLQYIFAKPFTTPIAYRPKDRDVSKYMIAYWTNFARTGDPNNGDSRVPTPWLPYSTENQEYLEITHKIDLQSMKQRMRTEFVQFWAQSYQNLPSASKPEPY